MSLFFFGWSLSLWCGHFIFEDVFVGFTARVRAAAALRSMAKEHDEQEERKQQENNKSTLQKPNLKTTEATVPPTSIIMLCTYRYLFRGKKTMPMTMGHLFLFIIQILQNQCWMSVKVKSMSVGERMKAMHLANIWRTEWVSRNELIPLLLNEWFGGWVELSSVELSWVEGQSSEQY